ncbi:acyl-CoA dehydrogenase family protein [Ramlibacter sp. PS3R-8]|uniref:acyl-CoA dehydrogenase family protein n=1 Tax=Ramlibacter sp. PS3R-8 TaxID=3133437 RepID=UPI00309C4B1E
MQFRFGQAPDLAPYEATRARVRAFLEEERAGGRFVPWKTTWTTFDRGFTRRAGERGFIGMTWPRRYGGGECPALERYVVVEEMLAAGAPCGAHWIADRQSGPQILLHGSQRARDEILPRIVRGECAFGIGMSEPDSGSDLAAVRTRAQQVDGGWRITGTKVWTTNAHQVDYLIVLVRTDPEAKKHAGLTQMIVDTRSPGVTVRPILDLSGHHEFNEVHFEGCFVPDDMLIGAPGDGWKMVTSELSLERSGPDRFLSAFQLLLALVDEVGRSPDAAQSAQVGRLVAHLVTLRTMSASVAGLLQAGTDPATEAALIKDLGTTFEREIPELARLLVDVEPAREGGRFAAALAQVELVAPSFTLRGGTREVLRGILARALGLR